MLPTPLHIPSIQPAFLTTTNSAVMQRTLQTRRLYTKLSLINNKLQAEKSRLSASFVPSADNPSASYSKFNELLKKAQTPLQMNSHVKLRRTIENLTKGGGGGGGNAVKAGSKKEEGGRKDDEEEVDMDAILKNIGQICKISSYFDRIFKIDKKQKYLNIETQSYWENIDTSPEKKRILMEIYEKVHGVNQKFTFAKYQNEFERIWLNILKNITDDDKEIIFGLLNGGKALKTDEDKQLLREFDPLKLALKLEQKLDKSKSVQQTESLLPTSPSCSSNNRKTLASLLQPDKKQTQECACKHIHNMDVYTLKKKYKSVLKVPTFLPPTKKTFANILKTLPSEKIPSEQPKDNPEIKIIKGLLSQNPRFNEEAELKAFNQEKNTFPRLDDENKDFLQLIQRKINESYEIGDSPVVKSEKNAFILEKFGYHKKKENLIELTKRVPVRMLDPAKEEMKKCESILNKKFSMGVLKLSFHEIMKQRKMKLKHGKKKENEFK